MSYFLKIVLNIFILSSFFISITLSGTIDPNTLDTAYVEYGQKFEYVVKLCGTEQDDSLFCASATIIDDNHILTAAHVVKNCKTCFITINDKKYMINTIIINKDFDSEFGIGDIALGYSKEKFNLKFYPSLYTESTEENEVCSIVGYGLTGTFTTGAIKSDCKKRGGSNIIDRIYKDMLICSPSYRSSGKFTELEFLIASGDSGGGLFIDGKLAGINSCVMASGRSPQSKYNEESGHTRISKFVEWINENKIHE